MPSKRLGPAPTRYPADIPDDWHAPDSLNWQDIGAGHAYVLIVGSSERAPIGIIERHTTSTGDYCGGYVGWTVLDDRPTWQLHTLSPLTLTPSILCRACGSHGYITDGRWVNA